MYCSFQVIVLITFGRIGSDDKNIFQNAVWRMKERYPEAKLIVATRSVFERLKNNLLIRKTVQSEYLW